MITPRRIRHLLMAGVCATTLAAGTLAATASTASAAPATTTSTPNVALVSHDGAAVGAAVTARSGSALIHTPASGTSAVPFAVNCDWHPANNAADRMSFVGTNVNIRTGPSSANPACTAIGEGEPGDGDVWAHCYTNTPGYSYSWIYLTDYTRNKEGWAYGQYVYLDSPLYVHC